MGQEKATALHEAAANGHKKIVELLLAYKADIDFKDISSRTCLDRAADEGHDGVVELLRQHAQKLDQNLAYPDLPDLKSYPILNKKAARKAESIIDSCRERLGSDFRFPALFDYAARECNTGNHDVAAELFHRIYESLKTSGGHDETMVLSAFACSYCACRAKSVWPISEVAFPSDLTPRYLEARGRFVATLILAHASRNGIAKCVRGDSSEFEVRIRNSSVHHLRVQDGGDVVVVPAIHDPEMQVIVEKARHFQLTIPCLFTIVGAEHWW